MVELYSQEAEEKTIGYLFNPFVPNDKKEQTLQLLTASHFTDEKLAWTFEEIKKRKLFDKIVLWNACQNEAGTNIDFKFLNEIDDIVTEVEIESYLTILFDKYQKRQVYYFGKQIQDEIVKGSDQFEVALKAQSILSSIGSKKKLTTNRELLDMVLNESPGEMISTGFEAIDNFIGGYTRGMIITIAGDSGHMKTTLALDKASRMAEAANKPRVGIFSKEMLATDLLKKQISKVCKIPTNLIFSQKYDKEFVRKKMMEVEAWREDRIKLINPNSFYSVADIAKIQMTYRFDIWFLDFIQLLEFSKVATNSSDYNIQIGQNMRNLQSLALATKSVGIILSQVKKGIEYRKDKKPTISDIEWSGLIKQLSSYIFFSYYPGKYYGFDAVPEDHYYLIAEKTRFAESFIYPMKVNPSLGIFTEIKDSTIRGDMIAKIKKLIN